MDSTCPGKDGFQLVDLEGLVGDGDKWVTGMAEGDGGERERNSPMMRAKSSKMI